MPAGPIGQPSIIPSPCLKLNAPSPFQQCSNNSAITILSLPCGTVNNYLPPPVVHIVYIKETSWLCISRKSLLILVSLVFKDEQTKQASSFCFIIQRSQRCTIHPESLLEIVKDIHIIFISSEFLHPYRPPRTKLPLSADDSIWAARHF